MKLILIGGIAGLILGVSLTLLYFIFAKFFTVQARALDRSHEKAQLATQIEKGDHRRRMVGSIKWIVRKSLALPPKPGISTV